eukprot:2456673-Lingulodinium_polyedra.AAC.1
MARLTSLDGTRSPIKVGKQRSPIRTRGPNTCSRHGNLKRRPAERSPTWATCHKSETGRITGAAG